MKTNLLLVSTISTALALAACGFSHASAKSSSPYSLDPNIISRFLKARAEVIDKSVAINAPVDAILEEARLDCKSKGFQQDAKGVGIVNLDANGLLACVPKPPEQPKPANPPK
jgi:hypothetical protein